MTNKTVIFDLDNTLIITSVAAKDAYKRAIHYIADQHGMRNQSNKLYHHWKRIIQSLKQDPDPVKRQLEYSLKLLLQKHKIPETYLNQALTLFNKHFLSNLKIQRGAKEIINWLKLNNITVAVATESMRGEAKKKLKAVGLLKNIDILVTSNDIGTMKPNPAYYQKVISLTKTSKKNTVVVGDQIQNDIEPSETLGIKAILIPPNNFHLGTIKKDLVEHFQLSLKP